MEILPGRERRDSELEPDGIARMSLVDWAGVRVAAPCPAPAAGPPARRSCRYVLCTLGRQPVDIDIYDYRDPYDDVFLEYYVRAFRHMEEAFGVAGLTFYIVWNCQIVRDLPSYGDDVVAVLLQDEACTVPSYLGRVRFVFKAYGFRPWAGEYLRRLNVSSVLKSGKNAAVWSYHFARFVAANRGLPPRRGGMVIPLGYARQTELPVRPLEARRYLVSFVGSLENMTQRGRAVRALLGSAKSIARARMLAALRRLAEVRPEEVRFATTGSFHDSIRSDGASYSELMADTRICLAPRGSSVETYRFFEGLRQGCIVVCDRLPPHWFYEGCPAIQLDDWDELDGVVEALAADPARMAELHRASLAWWEAKCSEPALAAVFAAQLAATCGAES